jgi:hypothetical protein
VVHVEGEDAAAVIGRVADARHTGIQEALCLLCVARRDQRQLGDEAQRGCE